MKQRDLPAAILLTVMFVGYAIAAFACLFCGALIGIVLAIFAAIFIAWASYCAEEIE